MAWTLALLLLQEALLDWGRKGDKDGEFHSPIGLAIDAKDVVYVSDLNNARVSRFDVEGKYLGSFSLPPDDPKRPAQSLAGGIAVDAKGLIYLGFMNQHAVRVYAADGTLAREWGKKGKGDGEFNQAGGIVIAPDGTVLVADQGNHRVQAFKPDGTYVSQWGGHGTDAGRFGGTEPAGSRFAGPHFLALDAKGRVYTTEGVAGRVQALSLEGRPLLSWGSKGTEPGAFGALKTPYAATLGPIAVFADPKGRVWVSSLNDRVQAFDAEGNFLFALPGPFSRPHGMATDSRGLLYVADSGAQRIRKFRVP